MNEDVPPLSGIGYFRIAKDASKRSIYKYRVGAVISNGRPISIGFNSLKTHPRYANGRNSYSVHAEVSAIIRAGCNVRGLDMYVYRESADGKPALAKPCNNCLKIIIESGIKRVYYSKPSKPYYGVIRL